MIDTVVSVRPRNDNKPGYIKFSSAGEKSTFNDDALNAASRLIGQRAEYTLEEREGKGGKTYYNVGSVVPAAGPAPAEPASRGLVQQDVELLSIASALNRIAAALERATASNLPPSRLPLQEKPREEPPATPSLSASNQSRLAAKVGNDAARAMLAALDAKYPDAGQRNAAVAALLLAHGA